MNNNNEIGDVVIMLRDLRPAGLCREGGREWAEKHGLDFDLLIQGKATASMLRATGCPLAERACAVAEKRVRDAMKDAE